MTESNGSSSKSMSSRVLAFRLTRLIIAVAWLAFWVFGMRSLHIASMLVQGLLGGAVIAAAYIVYVHVLEHRVATELAPRFAARPTSMRYIVLLAALLTVAACDNRPAEQGKETAAATKSQPQSVPSRSGYAAVNGARFHYQLRGDLGSGKTPLLVLHGSYMSADAMAPLVEGFAATRPVIALDARGHGRTGDLPGPITYEQLADDAAGVLTALKVPTADVLGYSMGAITALAMAARHPDKVGKQIILSGISRRNGWYPELNAAFTKVTPEAFAGTPLESEYKRLSPTPNAFPTLVEKLRGLDQSNYDMSDDAIRGLHGKTMFVVGDADGVQLEHAIGLFKLRGGEDRNVALQGFMTESPRARLLILPGTTHIGIMANADLIAQLAVPFLDDAKPPISPGFLKDTSGVH